MLSVRIRRSILQWPIQRSRLLLGRHKYSGESAQISIYSFTVEPGQKECPISRPMNPSSGAFLICRLHRQHGIGPHRIEQASARSCTSAVPSCIRTILAARAWSPTKTATSSVPKGTTPEPALSLSKGLRAQRRTDPDRSDVYRSEGGCQWAALLSGAVL